MSKHTAQVLMTQLKEEMQVILAQAGPASTDLVFTAGLDSAENPTLLIGQPATVGTPVAFDAARTYGVLGASAVTNTGSTVLTGNLGIYPGTSITGFPPGTVSGSTDVANVAAQSAQASALATYNSLQALTPTTIATALDGQTLTPGTYKAASGTFTLAASAGGTLTLNGPGIYVFQTTTTLTTGAGGAPVMTLTNGAKASDVYFVVGSSATINSGTAGTFNGNIIASASITDTMGGIVNGSLVALNAAVTLSAAAVINTQQNTSAANCLIRLAPFVDDIARVDALGIAQRVYAPHVCDLLAQKTLSTDSPANTPVDVAGLASSSLLGRVIATAIAQVRRKGVKIRLLDQANGTNAPVATSQLATAVLRYELGDFLFKRSGEV